MIYRIQGENEKDKGIYYEFDSQSKPLGVGGMGSVYLGHRVVISNGTKTPVAIKVIHDNLPEHVIERARREASIQIHSDNLVEMFGFIDMVGSNQYGDVIHKFFVVSEYLNGVMLDDFLNGIMKNQFGEINAFAQDLFMKFQNNRLEISIHIIKHILSAIMLLHDKGFIHRDIDPTNIMITNDGNIKLIDFGIAKKLNALGTQDKLTSTGSFIGKPQYAAPELVTGDIHHQDETTDIYAIGILFYQLLTGKLPFSGASHLVMDAQLHQKMPLKNIINKDCRQIISIATSKNQKDRYSSASAFRVAVESIDQNKSNPAPILKIFLISAAAAILLIIGVISYSLFDKKHDQPEVQVLVDNNIIPVSSDTTNCNDIDRLIADLYSPDAETVKKSWDKINDIENDSKALFEIGLTYCTSINSKKMDNIPKDRQTILGINEMPLEKKKMLSHEKLWKSYECDHYNYRAIYLLANDIVNMENDKIALYEKSNCEKFFNNNEAKELLVKNNAVETFTTVKASFLMYIEAYKLASKAQDKEFVDKCKNELQHLEAKNGLYYFKYIK